MYAPLNSRTMLLLICTHMQNFMKILAYDLFNDLHPVAHLSKLLQEDEFCVGCAIEVMMKTKKALNKVKPSPIEDLPTVKKLRAQVKNEAALVTYQGQKLKDIRKD